MIEQDKNRELLRNKSQGKSDNELSESEQRTMPESKTKEFEPLPSQQPSSSIEDRPKDQRVRRQKQRHYPFKQEKHREGRKDVSVVIPLFNEEQSLPELYEKLRNVLSRLGRFEIIFVDDGSTDGSNRVLHDLRRKDRRIKIIRFRRNFGKSAALSVGFEHAEGDVVITMDSDLQDDPEEIPNLINELKKGYDLISGWKKKRRDPLSKTIPSRFFNFVTSLLTGIRLHDFNCGLKVYRNEVVKDVKIYGELHRYIPALAHWLGYRVGEVVVQHQPRKYGKSKYGVVRFWRGFLDLLTVLFTTRYLKRPLHLFGFWGSMFFSIGFIIDLYLVYLKFAEGMALSNRPLFLGGILLIIVGIQFISIGLIGELITKTYHSTEKEYSIRDIWK